MVNHWMGADATACGRYSSPLAEHVSTEDRPRVSCPDCRELIEERDEATS